MKSMNHGARYIESISIRGFKSIASIDHLPLMPINVLIGANGSGKSNFIGALAFLQAFAEGHLTEFVARGGGAERFLHFGSKLTPELLFRLQYWANKTAWSIGFSPTANDGFFYQGEIPDFAFDAQSPWQIFHVHDTSSSAPIRMKARLHDNRFLRSDASNLAAFLYLLQEKHPAAYGKIVSVVRMVAPFFENFDLRPLNLDIESILLEWRHKGSDQYFDVKSLSDGTLRFIALATYFLQPVSLRPALLLVDEPELGLHPYAIELLASLIKQAAISSQVIITTQSPILLDYFNPEDVLVADRKDNATQIRRLDPSPLATWLEEYSLGQLWEKNYLGGRPAA